MRSDSDRWFRLLAAALAVGVVAVIVRLAWISDDAYITLRSVEHLLAGHGPVWNVGERVQTYSHALWFWLLVTARALVGGHYAATIGLSLLCSCAAIAVLLRIGNRPRVMVTVLCCLLASRAFGDYATSGLESPLTMLLLATVCLRLGSRKLGTAVFEASLWTALLAMTRPDLIVPAGPLVLAHVIAARSWRAVGLAALGCLPLCAWELFSVCYYSSFVPITAYAKALAPGIPKAELFAQGLKYYAYVFEHDPATLAIVAIGLLLGLVRGTAGERLLALGGLCYCGYVLRIGGGFMAGRFFVPPFAIAVALLAAQLARSERRLGGHVVAVLAVALAFVPGRPPYLQPIANDLQQPDIVDGISDERRFYYAENGMLSPKLIVPEPGMQTRLLREAGRTRKLVVLADRAGKPPFEAGELFHLIDPWLCDPLMMRLPVRFPDAWRIGHFTRVPPAGYLESLASGEDRVVHPGLARFHQTLDRALRAPFGSEGQLGAAFDLLLGRHGDGLRAYVDEHYRSPPRRDVSLDGLVPAPWPDDLFWFDDARVIVVGEGGIALDLDAPRTADSLRLLATPVARYHVHLCRDGERIATRSLVAMKPVRPKTDEQLLAYIHDLGGMHEFELALPAATTFDRIEIDAGPLAQIAVPAIGGLTTR